MQLIAERKRETELWLVFDEMKKKIRGSKEKGCLFFVIDVRKRRTLLFVFFILLKYFMISQLLKNC